MCWKRRKGRFAEIGMYESSYTVFQFLRRVLVLRAFSTLHSGATDVFERTGGRMMARARGRKRKREFLALLNWSAEPCELSSCWERILFLFYSLRATESRKFCRHFAVVRERAFPNSTDNDRNSRQQARSLVRTLGFLPLEKFRWLYNSAYSRIERLGGIIGGVRENIIFTVSRSFKFNAEIYFTLLQVEINLVTETKL